MSSTPANIAVDEVNDPLPPVVGGDMGRTVCNDEQSKDTNTSKSTKINDEMDEMLQQAHQQADNVASIAENMASMMQMMKGMQGEISRLTKKCDGMEKSLQKTNNNVTQIEKSIRTLPKKQNANIISRLDYLQTNSTNNIISRLDSIDDRLKYHEILLQNQKWEYSAPRPSEYYWEAGMWEDGNEDEEEAEEFLNKIRKETTKLRYCNGDGDIDISAELPYNKEFLPHWIEFADALEQYQHRQAIKDEETALRLCDMQLPDAVIDLLSNALKSTRLHKLELRDNNLGQKGRDFILNYLKHDRILKELLLYENPIFDSVKDIKRFCQIIRKHPSIKTFGITGYSDWHTFDTSKYQMLKSIMNAGKTKLTTIYLSDNAIKTGGGTFISDFLAKNPILENLHIEDNHLNDNDAVAIASALKHNTKLLCLDIGGNDFTAAGWEALEKVVFDKTSLNSAADSNHNCTIDFPEEDDKYDEVKSMNGSHPDSDYTFVEYFVRRKKIYNVLSARNRIRSNVEHFEDVPFELFPDMVVSIEDYSDYHIEDDTPDQDDNDVNPLSIVYEMCRQWDESLSVFESLSS